MPQWAVSSVSRPTNFAPGGDPGVDTYQVLVTNSGGAANTEARHGSAGDYLGTFPIPVTITDELPAGVVALPGATGEDERLVHNGGAGASEGQFGKDCAIGGVGDVSCTYEGVVEPGDTLILSFPVEVVRGKLPSAPFPSPAWPAGCEGAPAGAVSCVTNVVRVTGGGAPAPAEVRTPTVISEAPAGFGVAPGGESSALSSVQAGAHPDLTVTAAFDTVDGQGATAGNLKNTAYLLPAGFAGDLVDTPACAAELFLREECPPRPRSG